MTISTFAELKTALANWAERSDLTSRLPEFVSLCEDRIGQDLRVRAMETTADLTVNAQTVALPTRYVAMRRLYLDNASQRLDYYPPDLFWTLDITRETSKPRVFTIEGENLVFAPTPDTSYTGKILHYARFAALSADADTNWILTNARGLYLYGSLLELALYLEDDEAAVKWGRAYEDMLERVHKADRKDRHPPGMTSRSEVLKV